MYQHVTVWGADSRSTTVDWVVNALRSQAKPPGATFGIWRMGVGWGLRVSRKHAQGVLGTCGPERHDGQLLVLTCPQRYIRTHACTHKHACMHFLAGGPRPEEHTLMLRFQSWPQTKAAFILRVKWHDYLSSELLSIVCMYQPGGTRGRMNGRPLNTWASFHFIMTH